ncbi:hypothetical protein CRUP_003500 [Coryphaenoides rupestris]|nr:hypothetical protein CRUP_003500 [Coryphaenoides rupestris]
MLGSEAEGGSSSSFQPPKDATEEDGDKSPAIDGADPIITTSNTSTSASNTPTASTTTTNRYPEHGLNTDRYFTTTTTTKPSAVAAAVEEEDAGNPCSFIPYTCHQTSAAGPVSSYAPTAASSARYPPSSLHHFGSVLPPPPPHHHHHHHHTGFPSAAAVMCSPGRPQFTSAYHQFGGQGPNCGIYPHPYPGPGPGPGPAGAAAAAGGMISPMALHSSAAGTRAQVYLCNRPLWLKFHRHQTEMIITKQGRAIDGGSFTDICSTSVTITITIILSISSMNSHSRQALQ